MKKSMGRVPNLQNSQSVNQGELQNVRQKINKSMNQSFATGLTSNSIPSLNNSTSLGFGEMSNVDQKEQQKVRQKIQNSNSSISNRLY